MNRDFIHINDFVILVEEANTTRIEVDSCYFDEPLIAVAFYGWGNVDLAVKYGEKRKDFKHTKGLALSFYADQEVEFEHTVSADKSLKCLVVATKLSNLEQLPNQEGELFFDLLQELVNPKDHYVEGPSFFMTPEMEHIVDAFFSNSYSGKTKMMFFRSQITALLSHFFGQLALKQEEASKPLHREQLNKAKDILLENMENPPSLSELSKAIGFNTTRLKKEFKAIFGVPVFKYLQNERLTSAHKLISKNEATVQEAAWQVGYDSLSSFSNAFAKKFGYRPSQIK
ncbi:helix-turn-helix domain-containing protein [Maribacter algarum]|uniref:Helix-turn-helix domain-containing protein n=1 Tax=Maribacter algarum (ex Zhang et al. 2020) TaxID=2578118 RepID=A0A5S3PDL0_9FLAO|nr:helix-turn-helix domain-containing protein [Maribacter algarum]TMM51993.1 helix-turn-helix domain-containing protein [Maribacter algarum]